MKKIQSRDIIIWRGYYSKRLIFVILLIIFLILINNIFGFNSKQTSFILPSDFNEAVKLISRLHFKSPSLNGLKYRSMICTVVRNDPHLVEFLLRHLISGFSHIVVYDNNRILAGYDANITTVLAPFIAAGVVTHIPWYQNTIKLLDNEIKNGNSAECIAKHGVNADWVAILDTDEYFYYERNNVSFHTLNSLLLEMEQNQTCGIVIQWSMMYGEAKVLKQNTTLLEAYPRICGLHTLGKVLARSNQTTFQIPHSLQCLSERQNKKTLIWNENLKIALVHYYSKSIEEFLIKADQSVPPYIRQPIHSYDLGPTCNLKMFNYSEDYRRIFFNAYEQLKTLYPIIPNTLRSPPSLNIKEITDYALYIHLKYRCANRHEFDNDKYLSIHPGVKTSVENNTLVDGLYHFMANFLAGVKGCWKTDTYSFCE